MSFINNNAKHIRIEGSKSIINRVLILVSMLKNPITLHPSSTCNDVKTIIENLEKLGFEMEVTSSLKIIPPEEIPSRFNLHIEDSATGLRFLLARLAAISKRSFRVSFSKQLQQRPLMPLLHVLYQMGAKFTLHQDSISIDGTRLKGGVYQIPGNISSQFVSALCLIAPLLDDDLELLITDTIVSESYIQMTLAILKQFGIVSEKQGNSVFIASKQNLTELSEYKVESDFSSAAYYWAYGALFNKAIETDYEAASIQNDVRFLKMLETMGVCCRVLPDRVMIQAGSSLHGIEISMVDMPDQVPTLAVLALFADSPTRITDINHLRYKESNRLQALSHELRKLGATILVTDDSIQIHPLDKQPEAVVLNTYNDHRLVMSFSILKAKFPCIALDSVGSVEKSNPLFFKELDKVHDFSLNSLKNPFKL